MPKFIEVCSGCGGLSSGFINLGFEPLLLNEVNKIFCETLRINHNNANIDNQDMCKLDLKKYKGKVDILMGGVPCQSFSIAGIRKGLDDPRGQLMLEFNRLINECKPKIILIENVKGLVNHDGGKTLKQLIKLFNNDGDYNIKFKVLNSKYFNVPQKRERIFIIGIRNDIDKEFIFPDGNDEIKLLKDVLINVPESIGAKYPENKRKIMELIPPGGCWINLPKDKQLEYMGAKMLASGGGKRGVARRLSMNEACLTLTTSPTQKQTERCHPNETRPLSVREYARIQTFPDDYKFAGSMMNQYKQIGNAVPIKLAEAIATSIKSFLN